MVYTPMLSQNVNKIPNHVLGTKKYAALKLEIAIYRVT